MSRVDVVVPCYNYGRYLERCVTSALDQPGVDVRVLIIDDCSSDDSEAVGRRLAAREPRIEFRRHRANRGHIATYNEGLLGWANRDYVLLLSADDALTPGALARAARAMDAHSDAGLCYGRQVPISDDEPAAPGEPSVPVAWRVITGGEFLLHSCQSGANPVPTPTAVVRTSLQHLVGGYRADLPHTADLELWLRLAQHGPVIALDGVQAFKRMHGANMQHQYVATLVPDLEQRHAAFEIALGARGDQAGSDPEADALLRRARHALADEALWAASRAFDGGEVGLCDALLECASGFDPGVRSRRPFARLVLKRRLGPVLWSLASPLVEAGRRLAHRRRAPLPSAEGLPLHRAGRMTER